MNVSAEEEGRASDDESRTEEVTVEGASKKGQTNTSGPEHQFQKAISAWRSKRSLGREGFDSKANKR